MSAHNGMEATKGGFSLIEVVIATGVLVVGCLVFVSLFGAASDVGRTTRETAIAVDAAACMMERLEAYQPQSEVTLLYNADPDDDPPGAPPVEGLESGHFTVDGLRPRAGVSGDAVGEVIFPINPYTGAVQDGVDDVDVERVQPFLDRMTFGPDAEGVELVPVIVRLEWDAGGRVRRHEVVGVLSP